MYDEDTRPAGSETTGAMLPTEDAFFISLFIPGERRNAFLTEFHQQSRKREEGDKVNARNTET